MKKDRAKTVCICNGCKELLEYGPSMGFNPDIKVKIVDEKDIHIGDLFKMTAKYPDDRFNNRYILVKSITKRHYDTVWVEALIINEDINIEYQLCDYMMWFSEESIYRYHKVYNVFELEGQNGHKVV